MKVKGITKVEIEIDPQSINLTSIDFTKYNIDEVIYNLYKRIGMEEYIYAHGITDFVYYDEKKGGIYYQGKDEIVFNSFLTPEPILITTDEKTIELFKLLKQLEKELKAYINDSEELIEIHKMKKSMR